MNFKFTTILSFVEDTGARASTLNTSPQRHDQETCTNGVWTHDVSSDQLGSQLLDSQAFMLSSLIFLFFNKTDKYFFNFLIKSARFNDCRVLNLPLMQSLRNYGRNH